METEFIAISVMARRVQSQPEGAGGEASQAQQYRASSTRGAQG